MTDSNKVTSALSKLAAKHTPAGDIDSAAFSRIAQAMNREFRGSPEYAMACRSYHNTPHMTGPAVANLAGVDFQKVRPAPKKFAL